MGTKTSDDRFTYRFVHAHRAQEVHGDTSAELMNRAIDHLHHHSALPIHIRQGKKIVHDVHDIVDAWEAKYL